MIHNKERDPYKEKHRRPKNNPTSELMPPFFPKIMSTGENTRKPGERHDNNENSKISEPQNKHKSYRSHSKRREKGKNACKNHLREHPDNTRSNIKVLFKISVRTTGSSKVII